MRQRVAGMLPAALAFALALALYERTGAPTVLTGDQAEHQYAAYVVGVPHATGYPLFTSVNALAVRLLPIGDVARRVTLMTALWSALAVLLAYLVAYHLSGRRLAGLLAAATLAVSAEFWSLAVIAEVYTLQVLLILLIWWCLLRWWQSPWTSRWLYGAALVSGVATTHHGSFVPIVGPALLVVVVLPLLSIRGPAARRASLAPLGIVWHPQASAAPPLGVLRRCLAWGMLGLTPWLYLAAQFALFQPFDYYRGQGLPYHYYWGNPATWADVANLALGAGFRDKVFTYGWEQLPALLVRFVATLRQELWWSAFALGAAGGIALLLRHPRAGRFSALVFVGAALFGINVADDVPKAHVYYLPAYVIWSVWAGVGAGWLADQAGQIGDTSLRVLERRRTLRSRPGARVRRTRLSTIIAVWSSALLLVLLALPFLLGWRRYERLDRSVDDGPGRFATAVLTEVAPNAVILCRWEQCQPLRYRQLVEGQRPDVQLDQTEPEGGANWAERAALYLPHHPVYAIQFNEQLATRYPIYPLSETYDLWEVRRLEE
jgi:hypothetical protein